MSLSRKRRALVGGAVAVALLAVPAVAGANPGTGPELVQRTGTLVVLHGDRPDGSSTQQWELVNGLDQLRVRAPEDVWIEPGTPVRLEGTMQNGALVLADSASAVKRTGASPLAADPPLAASGPAMHTTAVILFGFSSSGGPSSSSFSPSAATDAATLMFGDPISTPSSLNSYYLEQTYNQIGFSGDVYGPFNIAGPAGAGSCALSGGTGSVQDWGNQALTAANLPHAYQHYVFVFPYVSACAGWAGLAEVGGSHVWINGAFQVPVVAHELGHNLGLSHAGGLLCTSGNPPTQVSMSSSCTDTTYEYDDPFDAMGVSDSGQGTVLRQMSMQHKLKLNLLPASAVQVVSASGTYHLAPMETLSGSVELLKIPKPGGGNYYVEYRQPTGVWDGHTPAIGGIYIRTESPEAAAGQAFPNADTALIDMHPATLTWTDAQMDIGQVFNDAIRGILIQDMAETSGDATLSITLPVTAPPPTGGGGAPSLGAPAPGTLAPPTPAKPTTPTNVTAKLTKAGEVLLTWGGSSGTFGISGYRVLRNGAVIATTSSTAYVDRTPKPGPEPQVTYSVVAVDVAGTASLPGTAAPLRAALLRALSVSHLKVTRAKIGKRKLLRVKGTVSDADAVCRVRVAGGPWHPCKAKPTGAFAVSLRAKGKKPVTLSLRDALGRVKLQTLRVR